MEELKVFRMDDYTWVIAESKKQAIEWWNKEFDFHCCDDEVYEVNYDGGYEDAGYWKEVAMKDFDAPQIGMFKNWHGMFCQFVWFRDAIKSWSGDVPAVIAATEA